MARKQSHYDVHHVHKKHGVKPPKRDHLIPKNADYFGHHGEDYCDEQYSKGTQPMPAAGGTVGGGMGDGSLSDNYSEE